jgi:hypothetical protein
MFPGAMRRITILFVLLSLVLVLGGCGEDPVDKANAGEVRSVVLRFAAASDASACDLLTAEALRNVYGGFGSKLRKARAACRKRSGQFRGEQVKITKLDVIDNETARVAALSRDEKFTYSVTVRRPAKRWLIDQITLHKVR